MSSSSRTVDKLRSIKLNTKLEKAWNGTVSLNQEPKRLAQMTIDIKHLIMRSMSDQNDVQHSLESFGREKQKSLDSFSKISSTLGFKHHEGTDRSLELKVIKVIMVREGLLMNIRFQADKALKKGTLEGNNLIEILAQLRETTLSYLEYLCLWRQSSRHNDSNQLLPFIWEKENYTLKLINDLDFLGSNFVIIEALNLSEEQLRSNPLMLSSNLEDFNTWMDPAERAALDTNGAREGQEYQTRLRLRFAERILLQEMEANNSTEMSQVFLTQDEKDVPIQNRSFQPMQFSQQAYADKLIIGSNILENDFEDDRRNYGALYPSGTYNEVRPKTSDVSSPMYGSLPQSRASTISPSYNSAPPSSYGSRGFQTGNNNLQSQQGFGHEFFTGTWAESQSASAFFSSSVADQRDDMIFVEDGFQGQYSDDFGFQPSYEQRGPQQYNSYDPALSPVVEDDGFSVRSRKSIESMSEVDISILTNLLIPTKSALLAASVCVILISKGNEIPEDISWKAFIRLLKRVNLSEIMINLTPARVSKFKIVAVQPIIDQLISDNRLNSAQNDNNNHSISLQELIAINKLTTWVKQFALPREGKKDTSRKSSPFKKVKLGVKEEELKEEKRTKAMEEAAMERLMQGHKSKAVIHKVKKVMPKVTLDLVPFHTDVLTEGFPEPILLQLMTSPDLVQGNKLVPRAGVELAAPRLVLKARDSAEGKEAILHINMREFSLYLEDLVQKYGEEARHYFAPHDLQWWQSHAKQVIHVQHAPMKPMKISVVKLNIDDMIFDRISEAHLQMSHSSTVHEGEEIVAFHSFAINKGFPEPILLQLMTSPDLVQGNKLVPRAGLELAAPRLVVKARDSAEGKEAILHINMREFSLYLEDLVQKYGEEARHYFAPHDLQWWQSHAKQVIHVQEAVGRSLTISVSKGAIDEIVLRALNTAASHKHAMEAAIHANKPAPPPKSAGGPSKDKVSKPSTSASKERESLKSQPKAPARSSSSPKQQSQKSSSEKKLVSNHPAKAKPSSASASGTSDKSGSLSRTSSKAENNRKNHEQESSTASNSAQMLSQSDHVPLSRPMDTSNTALTAVEVIAVDGSDRSPIDSAAIPTSATHTQSSLQSGVVDASDPSPTLGDEDKSAQAVRGSALEADEYPAATDQEKSLEMYGNDFESQSKELLDGRSYANDFESAGLELESAPNRRITEGMTVTEEKADSPRNTNNGVTPAAGSHYSNDLLAPSVETSYHYHPDTNGNSLYASDFEEANRGGSKHLQNNDFEDLSPLKGNEIDDSRRNNLPYDEDNNSEYYELSNGFDQPVRHFDGDEEEEGDEAFEDNLSEKVAYNTQDEMDEQWLPTPIASRNASQQAAIAALQRELDGEADEDEEII